jgi:hypothetical protein
MLVPFCPLPKHTHRRVVAAALRLLRDPVEFPFTNEPFGGFIVSHGQRHVRVDGACWHATQRQCQLQAGPQLEFRSRAGPSIQLQQLFGCGHCARFGSHTIDIGTGQGSIPVDFGSKNGQSVTISDR